MNIYGEKVFLRAMEPEDMAMLCETVNDPQIERMVGGWSFPLSQYEQMRWYERVAGDKNALRFIIALQGSGEAVGMANLVDLDWKNRSAFHGIKLKASAPKREGIAFDAVMALMRYVFDELQLVRLDGSWIEYNTPSIALYKKCGWKVEGKKEKAIFKNGRYYTLYLGGILAEDFQNVRRESGWEPTQL